MGGLLRAWTGFEEYLTCNVLATQRLLEAVRAAGRAAPGPRLHLVGLRARRHGDETRPAQPVSPYGVTKLAAENLVPRLRAQLRRAGAPSCATSRIYGPRQRPDMGYYIFIDHVLRGEVITVFGDGRQTRGNTYVDDCVGGHGGRARPRAHRDMFNIGGGEVVSAIDALALIERLTGRTGRGSPTAPPRPGEQRQALAERAGRGACCGWAPRTGIETACAAQVAWQGAALSQAEAAA